MFAASEIEMAIKAKNYIYSMLFNGESLEEILSELSYYDECQEYQHGSSSIKEKAMLYAALSQFYIADNGQFWEPATIVVLDNYRKVKRAISKRKPVYVTFLDFDEDCEDYVERKLRIK